MHIQATAGRNTHNAIHPTKYTIVGDSSAILQNERAAAGDLYATVGLCPHAHARELYVYQLYRCAGSNRKMSLAGGVPDHGKACLCPRLEGAYIGTGCCKYNVTVSADCNWLCKEHSSAAGYYVYNEVSGSAYSSSPNW